MSPGGKHGTRWLQFQFLGPDYKAINKESRIRAKNKMVGLNKIANPNARDIIGEYSGELLFFSD